MKLIARDKTIHGTRCWEVRIPLAVCGKRKRIYRPTEREAIAAATSFVEENRKHGSELTELTSEERAFIMRLREKKIPLRTAEKAAEKAAPKTKPLLRALNEYLVTQEGNSYGHIKSLKSCYTIFAAAHPHRNVEDIATSDIATYLHARKSNERAIFRRLRAFFRWATMMEFVEKNPMERLPSPCPENGERKVFTIKQMRALLTAAADNPTVLRFLVFGGFFGLRTSEIEKLRCEDVHVGDCEVFVRHMKTSKKGMRERYVVASAEAIPNGKAWLEKLKLPKTGPVIDMNDKNLRLNRDAVIARANGDDVKEAMKPGAKAEDRKGKLIEWPFNVLRRSFASYHLAAFENQNLTAALMGHTTSDTTFAKYRAVRRKADGAAWFGIMTGVIR